MAVLIIAPHPDDEVLGCGGVMAKYAAQGEQVFVLVVTRGIPEIFEPAEIERTRGELRKAHDLLQVAGTRFLDFPAPGLDMVPGHELADAIAGVIRDVRPETVYVPHRGDIHADHQRVHEAALVAARPIDGCSVRRILSYETLSETEWAPPAGGDAFVPTVFEDVGPYLQTKLEAMRHYASQLKRAPHSRSLQIMEALARFRGATVGLEAAEAFMLVREVVEEATTGRAREPARRAAGLLRDAQPHSTRPDLARRHRGAHVLHPDREGARAPVEGVAGVRGDGHPEGHPESAESRPPEGDRRR